MTPSSVPTIAFDGVEKLYGEKTVLSGVTLAIEPGQFMVLLGPSGSGKSTMLRCLGGLEKINGGEIRFAGSVVSARNVHLSPDRRNLAMVFQDFALWPHMTIFENVAFALGRGGFAKGEVVGRVHDLLDRVGLGAYASRYPNTLSGGEQQRVSLARALVGSPAMILFDEPLSSLDTDLRERLRVEIAELTREAGASALYITHDQTEAFALADVVGVLNEGVLVQVGRPEVIYREPASPFVARFTGIAGELPGKIEEQLASGHVRVRTHCGVLDARLAGPRGPDDAVRLMVRGAPIRLLPGIAGPGDLRGRVVDAAFRGRGYDHVIDIGEGHRLLGVFAETRWERHRNVGVSIPAEACIAFPA